MDNKRIEKIEERAVVFLAVDYKLKKDVQKDIETGNRVAIVSTEEDVLSFYGAILNKYGVYNLYLVDNWEEVDDSFVDAVTQVDLTKEEVSNYLGKSLGEKFKELAETIKGKLSASDQRTIELVTEIVSGDSEDNESFEDVKTEAAIGLLTDRNKELQAKLNEAEAINKELRVKIDSDNETTQFTRTAIHLDAFNGVNTQVMYIREINTVSFFDSAIDSYRRYLKEMKRKKVKIVIFDERLFKVLYPNYLKIDDLSAYLGNRSLYMRDDTLVCKQIYPAVVTDLYRDGGFDLLILIDRILNTSDLTKGQNVHKYLTLSSSAALNYANELKLRQPEINFITDEQLNCKDSIIISTIKKDLSTPESELYWYSKLPNVGNDKDLIFNIFDRINEPKVVKKRGII